MQLDLEMLRAGLKSDLVLLLDIVEQEKGTDYVDTFLCYLYNYKVSEICRLLKRSRFRVNRHIKECIALLAGLVKEEGDIDLEQEIY